MLRAATAAALLGLALALALPALHLSAASTGHLVGRWWPVVPVAAGLSGVARRAGRRSARAGVVVALAGLAFLAGNFGMPEGPLLLAVLLVVAAAALVGLPWWRAGGRGARRLAGSVWLGGPSWRVENSSIYQWVGELHLDLTNSRLPAGTTPLRLGMFVGDVQVIVPGDVGVRAAARMFAGEIELLGHQAEGITPHLTVQSDDFAAATRRVDIDVEIWVGDIHVRRRG